MGVVNDYAHEVADRLVGIFEGGECLLEGRHNHLKVRPEASQVHDECLVFLIFLLFVVTSVIVFVGVRLPEEIVAVRVFPVDENHRPFFVSPLQNIKRRIQPLKDTIDECDYLGGESVARMLDDALQVSAPAHEDIPIIDFLGVVVGMHVVKEWSSDRPRKHVEDEVRYGRIFRDGDSSLFEVGQDNDKESIESTGDLKFRIGIDPVETACSAASVVASVHTADVYGIFLEILYMFDTFVLLDARPDKLDNRRRDIHARLDIDPLREQPIQIVRCLLIVTTVVDFGAVITEDDTYSCFHTRGYFFAVGVSRVVIVGTKRLFFSVKMRQYHTKKREHAFSSRRQKNKIGILYSMRTFLQNFLL